MLRGFTGGSWALCNPAKDSTKTGSSTNGVGCLACSAATPGGAILAALAVDTIDTPRKQTRTDVICAAA